MAEDMDKARAADRQSNFDTRMANTPRKKASVLNDEATDARIEPYEILELNQREGGNQPDIYQEHVSKIDSGKRLSRR